MSLWRIVKSIYKLLTCERTERRNNKKNTISYINQLKLRDQKSNFCIKRVKFRAYRVNIIQPKKKMVEMFVKVTPGKE